MRRVNYSIQFHIFTPVPTSVTRPPAVNELFLEVASFKNPLTLAVLRMWSAVLPRTVSCSRDSVVELTLP